MFLQIMPLSRYIADRRSPRRQLYFAHFPDGRVGLLGLGSVDFRADALPLGTAVEQGDFGFVGFGFSGTADRCLVWTSASA